MMHGNQPEAPLFRKSSFCSANGGCVEVAVDEFGSALVRDAKDPSGPVLRFSRDEWTAFVAGVRAGEFS